MNNQMTEPIAAKTIPPPALLRRCQAAPFPVETSKVIMTEKLYMEYYMYHTNTAANAANAANAIPKI